MADNYKYNFTEDEKLLFECWNDIVLLFRDVQREQIDNAILENKEYVINCLVEFICKLENLNQQFKENVYDDGLRILYISVVALMIDVSSKVNEEEAPIFYEKVYEPFKKSSRTES